MDDVGLEAGHMKYLILALDGELARAVPVCRTCRALPTGRLRWRFGAGRGCFPGCCRRAAERRGRGDIANYFISSADSDAG